MSSSINRLPQARPILFSGPMVQAILSQRKTQTRLAIKLPDFPWMPEEKWRFGECFVSIENSYNYVAAFHRGSLLEIIKCPYGKPGDLLWVRETYAAPHDCDHITLKITDIRVEQLQDIDENPFVWVVDFCVFEQGEQP